MQNIRISSPKRDHRAQTGWEAFFPYYAGFPEAFVDSILGSANLHDSAVVFDPWNGSGTTTVTAARRGYRSIGYDINPVMVIIARARLLPSSEADALEPILKDILEGSKYPIEKAQSEPLTGWFDDITVDAIRRLEQSIRRKLIGKLTLTPTGIQLDKMSSIAAAFYVGLFAVSRQLAASFQSTNPTWLRRAKANEALIRATELQVHRMFHDHMMAMMAELALSTSGGAREAASAEIGTADSTQCALPRNSVDLIVTSPPYCTRIDYTAATRVELSIINGLLPIDDQALSRKMIGSTRVPKSLISAKTEWGASCQSFLNKVATHPSKASSGYYLKTHLDYFEKMSKSFYAIRGALKEDGRAFFVVQDSFYKDVHNDLPKILSEMASFSNLKLVRREDFPVQRSMSGLNPNTGTYGKKPKAIESVLCFEAI